MASVSSSWTTSLIESTSRPQLIRRMLRTIKAGVYGTTTAVGSTTTLVDTTKLLSSQEATDSYVGYWLYMFTGTTVLGTWRQVSSYDNTTGTITVSSPFGASTGSGNDYMMLSIVHPQDVIDLLDDLLTQDADVPCWAICTEIADGDMEQSGTTDWTASNTTLTKVSTEPASMGSQWLSAVSTSTSAYARSALLNVTPGQPIHASVLARANASGTTMSLTVYDETNSAAIGTVPTTQLRTWGRLYTDVTIPSTCYSASLRLGIAENNKTAFFNQAVLYSPNDSDIALPWWVRSNDAVKDFFQLDARQTLATGVMDGALQGEPDERWDVKQDFGGRLRAYARWGTLDRELIVFGARNETAFASNTEVKRTPANWLLYGLCVKVLEAAIGEAAEADQDALREKLTIYNAKWETERKRMGNALRPLRRTPTGWVQVAKDRGYLPRVRVR